MFETDNVRAPKEPICYIVGAGECNAAYCKPEAKDYVIAADGGYHAVKQMGIRPQLLIGDFDSFFEGDCEKKQALLEELTKNGEEVIKLPKEKDDTDMLAAIHEGRKRGYRNFILLGAAGGRLDHTIANIQCLVFLSKQGCQAKMYGNDCEIQAVTDGCITFPVYEQGTVSVFSMEKEVKGIFLRGLKYPLNNACLTNEYPLGVSNEFIGKESSIEVKQGTILVIRQL